jgi:hypothetical protein
VTVPTFDAARQRLRQSAIVFGQQLRRWRVANGWAQDTAQKWGELVDMPHVYSSQWSQLETAVARNPGPLLFHALGVMNQRLHRQEYGPGIPRDLLDRLQGATAIVGANGQPWGGPEWFAAYLGQEPWPDLPDPERAPVISRADAEWWSEQFRVWFQQVTNSADLQPLEGATRLMEFVDHDSAVRSDFQHVVLGFGDYDPARLTQLWEGARYAPERWLDEWRRSSGVAAALRPLPRETSVPYRLV